jgi:hypothetical protein
VEQDIVNAFKFVTKMYEETSFLLKDFSEVMAQNGFKNVIGNAFGAEKVSKSINEPKYWSPRYASLFFKPESQTSNLPLLGVTVSFYDLEPKAIPPVLILGFARGMDHPKQTWRYEWFIMAYFNDSRLVEYFIEKDGQKVPMDDPLKPDGNCIYFKSRLGDDSYAWFKDGYLIAIPLLDVKDYNQIQQLSKQLITLWKEKLEKL